MPPIRASTTLVRSAAPSATRAAPRGAPVVRNLSNIFPVVSECPSPDCTCADMPAGLDIDYKTTLNGTMAAYNRHFLVSTGKRDWESKVEEEGNLPGRLIRDLKAQYGRGGRYHDPYKNTIITTSSFEPPASRSSKAAGVSATPAILEVLDFPSFTQLQYRVDAAGATDKPGSKGSTAEIAETLATSQQVASEKGLQLPITHPTVLICSHNTRDSRCGILGPILETEFKRHLQSNTDALGNLSTRNSHTFDPHRFNVGTLSHIGGHKWAGNVIIYLPRGSELDVRANALAGTGIWYGRVEPRHVPGIIEETMTRGRIVKELFRGGIDPEGKPLRV